MCRGNWPEQIQWILESLKARQQHWFSPPPTPSGVSGEGERAVPGIDGLAFVDDRAVANKLSEAAAASPSSTGRELGNTLAASTKVRNSTVHLNKEATRWLGVWLTGSQLP